MISAMIVASKMRATMSLPRPRSRISKSLRRSAASDGATVPERTSPEASTNRHRLFDCLERRFSLGAVGAARLRHVRPAAAALAAERRRTGAHQIDGAVALGQVIGDPDDHRSLAVLRHCNQGNDARANRLLALIGERLQIL